MSRNPLFQVIFALQNMPMLTLEFPGLKAEPLRRGLETTRFDIEFHLWEDAEGIRGILVFNSALFDSLMIELMAARFRIILEQAVAFPTRKLIDIDIRTNEEKAFAESTFAAHKNFETEQFNF